jgi:hypothetical protein
MKSRDAGRLTKTEVERTLDEAWRNVLKDIGLVAAPNEIKKYLRELKLSPETPVMRGLTLGMSLGLGSFGKTLARKVRTREQLAQALANIKEASEKMPTAMRKAFKEMTHALPRRGGPGRQAKLNPRETAQMCDQIGMSIRQGATLKQALQRVSEMTPTLLGKKVGARTLQKAWNKRREHTSAS